MRSRAIDTPAVRFGLLLGGVLLLGACTGTPPKRQWDLASVAQSGAAVVNLEDASGRTVRTVSVAEVGRLIGVADRIKAASRQNADLRLVDDAGINAFAGYSDGKAVVGVNFGLLDTLKPTDDEFAALLAHEHAHFALHHYEASRDRRAALSTVQILLGIALGVAGVPFGGQATDLAVHAVETTFTRDQEKAADLMSLDFLEAAGFDPHAAISLQQKLEAAAHQATIPFLSTHPSSSSRIAYLSERLSARGAASGRAAPPPDDPGPGSMP